MAQTVDINLNLDTDVKEAMEAACAEMGLSMSDAFTIFAKKIALEHRFPFDISVDPFFSEQNMIRLRKSIVQMESSIGIASKENSDE